MGPLYSVTAQLSSPRYIRDWETCVLTALNTVLGTTIATAVVLAGGVGAALAATDAVDFPTPGEHAIVIPAGVSSLHVVAIAGTGGTGNYHVPGGFGAKVIGDIAVTPGQTLYLEVGGNGTGGGFYGGAGGGGGASDVRTLPFSSGLTPVDSRLLIAGGGGGSGRGYTAGSDNVLNGSAGIGGAGNTAGGNSRQGGSPTSGGGAAGVPTGTGAGGTAGDDHGNGEAGAPGTLGVGGAGAYIDTTLQAPAPGGYNGGGLGGAYTATFYGNTFFYYGGGGGGGGLNGGGGGGGVVLTLGTAQGGGGGGGGSNLVPVGGSASTDATGSPGITVSFTDSTDPVLSLDAVPARAGAATTLTGHSGTILGDGDVTITIYAGPAATGAPVSSRLADTRTTTGDYSASLPRLADGQYTVQATQVDGAGNTGASTARTFIYDATPPAVSLTTPAAGSMTNDTTPGFTGVAGTAVGDGATVEVHVTTPTGTPVETVTGSRDATTGAFDFPASPALADGTYNAVVRQSDVSGNAGSGPAVRFTVDTHAPAPTLVAPAAARTNDATPTFAGTGGTDAGDANTVDVRVFSGPTTSGPPVATLRGSRADDGHYAVTADTPLADGTYTAQTVQPDAAGNTGAAAPHTFTVDTTAPVVSLAAPADGGPLPTFAGTGGTAPGDGATVSVTVRVGATLVQTLSAPRDPATGAFSVASPFALAAGTYTAQARQADDLGNAGTSAVRTFTIGIGNGLGIPAGDRRAPVLSLVSLTHTRFRVGRASGHGHPLARGTTLRYRLSEKATVTVAITRSGRSKVLGTLKHRSAAGAGHLAVSGRLHKKALRSGRYRMTIRATDAAGNRSRTKRISFRVG